MSLKFYYFNNLNFVIFLLVQFSIYDIEIFATAAIEDGKSISEGEERKEMLRKLGEVLSCVSLAAWELGATLDKVAFMNLNSVRNDYV